MRNFTFSALFILLFSFSVYGQNPDLIITEIMYNPITESNGEWIEIYNNSIEAIDLTGYVLDDNNNTDQDAANISEGILQPGKSVILFDDDLTLQEFEAAWGVVDAIPVANWPGLNNTGDSIGIWDSFESYEGDNVSQANVIQQVIYDAGGDWPASSNSKSIFLIALDFDNTVGGSWSLSSAEPNEEETPLFNTYTSTAGDIGSPGSLESNEDNEAPIITCPADIDLINEEGICEATSLISEPTATDNVSETFIFEAIRSDNLELTDHFPIGETTITWTATDEAGNTSESCAQLVIVSDEEAPTIICPADIDHTIPFGDSIPLELISPTATDNCQEEFQYSATRSDGQDLEAPFPLGTTTITWSTVDVAGNSSESCQQLINITLDSSIAFVTTWKTDNPGISEDNQITIHTSRSIFSGPYDYTVDWGDGSVDNNVTKDITHTYTIPGIYEISISGIFPAVSFGIINGEQKDNLKLLQVNQWGSQLWSDLNAAFDQCANLDVVATDLPDISELTILGHMFRGCSSLVYNNSLNDWDMSNITYMSSMFFGCSLFNQDIGNWDVSNVTNMGSMFNFSGFNQDIGNWNVSQVTSMNQMFSTSPFDQDIGDWDVSNVTDMSGMFRLAPFNHDIGDWDVSKVADMGGMFDQNVVFNQNLENWDTSKVVFMSEMFVDAGSFNQDISNWNVSNVTNMFWMFKNAGLSTENYDVLLNVWSTQQLQSGVAFDGGNSQYCLGEAARQKLIDDFGWTITDGGKSEDCETERPFITTWKTDNPGTSEDNQITIPTYRNATFVDFIYDFTVNWGDGTSDRGVAGDITHTYEVPGTYQVLISGKFPGMYFGWSSNNDREKLLTVDQWGDNIWGSFHSAYNGCSNLDIKATDLPNLTHVTSFDTTFAFCSNLIWNATVGLWDTSGITDMSYAFYSAGEFNQDIGNWNVSNVVTMNDMFNRASTFNMNLNSWEVDNVITLNSMFENAEAFNGAIGNWNVSNVTTMADMFLSASSFNQDISGWNTAEVSSMTNMFNGAISFNQNLAKWNVANVIGMTSMFSGAHSFNQDISSWNVSNVRHMNYLFNQASAFDQDLGQWNMAQVREMNSMFSGIKLSVENYDNTLVGWSVQSLQNNLVFDGGNSQYCLGEAARQKLIDDFGWTITDEGKSEDCVIEKPFVSTWKTDNSGSSEDNQITIPTFPRETYNYSVDWGDGTSDTEVTTDITHTYETPGTYQVSISGAFPRIYFEEGFGETRDQKKLISVDQWGSIRWSSMGNAFAFCGNMDVLATDIPDLTNTEDMSYMFLSCTSLVGNSSFNDWDVSQVNVMDWMFTGAKEFNIDIGDWNVQNVRNMLHMFSNGTFNQDIGRWDVSSVSNMTAMFNGNSVFDQDIHAWDVSNVKTMDGMFYNSVFNQDIGNWNVSSVTNMNGMFANSFLSTENYDNILIGWASLVTLQNGVVFDSGNSEYCQGEAARQKLIDDFGWTIIDAAKSEDCPTEGCPDLLANENENLSLPAGTFGSGLDTAIGVSDIVNGSDCAIRLVNSDPDQPWAKYSIQIDLAEKGISAGDRLFFSIDGNSTNGTARIEVVQNGRPNTWQIGHTFGAGWSTHEQTMTVPNGITTLDIWIYPNFAGNVAGSAHYDNLIVRKVEGSDCPDILANEDDDILLPVGTFGSGLDAANGVSDVTNGSECAIQLVNNDTNEPWAKYAIKIDLAENGITAGDELYFSIDGNSTNGQARIEVVENGRPNTWQIGHDFGQGWSTHEQTITVREGLQSLDIWLYPNFKNNVPGFAHYDNLVVRRAIPAGCPDDLANEDLSLPLGGGRYGSGLDVANGVSDITNGSDCAIQLVNNGNNEPWAKYVISIDLSKEEIAAGDELYFSIDGNSTDGQARIEVVENGRPNTWEIGHSFGQGWSTHEQTITVSEGVRTLDIWIYPNFGRNEPGSAHYDNLVVSKVGENGLAGKRPLNALKVYPNPASERVSVSFEKPVTMGSMEIFDMSGRSVRKIAKANLESTIDVQDLKSGVYLLKAIDEKGNQFTKRVIVKH
ncbi:BspA family leucine-rich repeat surface protein [Maribacter halichondriae]|uniref:BspA family leucine-rich repeat surface protein n=1 Tax=Maribacter halichondriae TaxID=2980554 RepID=UPI0023590529|nr:BspA family leucine-rich repeat surface protein [Maribacter sp. Hal144]